MTARVPADPPGPVGHRRVDGHGGIGLAAVEVGARDAPAWVIAHGAGSSARFVVAAFAAPVLAIGARLVTYDLRGHGASGLARKTSEHHLDVQAADLCAVADSTDGHVAVIGGISLGAHAAVRVVGSGHLDVDGALACLPAWTGSSQAGAGPHAAIAGEIRRVGVDGMLRRLRANEDLPPWLRETLLTDYARHDPASLRSALLALDGAAAPSARELARLGVPLAVLGWADDPGHPLEVARQWAGLAPRSRFAAMALGELDAGLDALGRRAVRAVRATSERVRGSSD